MRPNRILFKYGLYLMMFFPFVAFSQEKVGVNTTEPDGNLHIKGGSSIPFPNLRITETTDNFARIKLESEVAPNRSWDIAASSTEGFTRLNFFFQNDTESANLLSVSDEGILRLRSLTNDMRQWYYTNGETWRGVSGFFGQDYFLTAVGSGSRLRFGTASLTRMVLDSIGQLGLGTTTPVSKVDIRSNTPDDDAGLHLSNSDRSRYLRLSSGGEGSDMPGISWHTGDTLVLGMIDQDDISNDAPFLRLDGKRIEVLGTNGSVFIGEGAGTNDDLDDNFNTAVGDSAMFAVTTGHRNAAFGHDALKYLTEDRDNSAFGYQAMKYKVEGIQNTGIGAYALHADSSGQFNSAVGAYALWNNKSGIGNTAVGNIAMGHNQNGSSNTAVGEAALLQHVTGDFNTAVGAKALTSDTTGTRNTGVGYASLIRNRSGNLNVALGYRAMFHNDTGHLNVAVGARSLYHNKIHSSLVAVGDSALYKNGLNVNDPQKARNNTALGSRALFGNTSGSFNTAVGRDALFSNDTAVANTAIGTYALRWNTLGNYNTAVGSESLLTNQIGEANTANGFRALWLNTSGDRNTAVGGFALSENRESNDNTAVGHAALLDNNGGFFNTGLGSYAASNNTTGDGNVTIGFNAMLFNQTGGQNTIVGTASGLGSSGVSYSGNVFLGYQAGATEANSNRLYIENSNSATPLIYGEFDNDLIRINGDFESTGLIDVQKYGQVFKVFGDETIWYNNDYFSWGVAGNYNFFNKPMLVGAAFGNTPPGAMMEVHGDININKGSTGVALKVDDEEALWYNGSHFSWGFGGAYNYFDDEIKIGGGGSTPAYQLQLSLNSAGKPGSSTWTVISDRRLKQNIHPFEDGLEQVLRIQPVTFQYNETSRYDTDSEYIGVIAQELQQVAPYMVSENDSGYLDVDNSAMTYILINAVKELSDEHEKLINQLNEQQKVINGLMDAVATLQDRLKVDVPVDHKGN